MIEDIDSVPDGVIGVRAHGEISVDELAAFIEVRVDGLVASGVDIRFLAHLGPEFGGFGSGAWGDLTADLMKIRFVRAALVSDDLTLTSALNALKWTLNGRVRTYRDHEFERAVRWVAR